MEPAFWRARWASGQLGFHEGRPNALLARHAGALGEGRRVLVPLCGKAHDLAFLAERGHQVVGVELVEDAVRAFFAERGVTPEVAPRGPFTAYAAGAITLLAGDVFAATPALLGGVDALYDRAALIALPPEVRPRYAAHLGALLPAGATGLLVTLEYDPALRAGPPFAVPPDEVRALYAARAPEALEAVEAQVRTPGAPATERCWRFTR